MENLFVIFPPYCCLRLPFHLNTVFVCLPRKTAAASPRSLFADELIARSYPIQTVIQLSTPKRADTQHTKYEKALVLVNYVSALKFKTAVCRMILHNI